MCLKPQNRFFILPNISDICTRKIKIVSLTHFQIDTLEKWHKNQAYQKEPEIFHQQKWRNAIIFSV